MRSRTPDGVILFENNVCSKVYTGTYGQLEYLDTPIFLYTEDGDSFIPAPLYFWKVIHNEQRGEATVFVGLNDPHASGEPALMCKNE